MVRVDCFRPPNPNNSQRFREKRSPGRKNAQTAEVRRTCGDLAASGTTTALGSANTLKVELQPPPPEATCFTSAYAEPLPVSFSRGTGYTRRRSRSAPG